MKKLRHEGKSEGLSLRRGLPTFSRMKRLTALILAGAIASLVSCGSGSLPVTELSGPEQNLLATINSHRLAQGRKALVPTANLTDLARKDATRRLLNKGGNIDNRQETGYERMLTLAGKAKAGDQFGNQLMGSWQKHPIQSEWLNGSYAGVGVGTAAAPSGLQSGVLLLGGFGGAGL